MAADQPAPPPADPLDAIVAEAVIGLGKWLYDGTLAFRQCDAIRAAILADREQRAEAAETERDALRDSNEVLVDALGECAEANAGWVAANDALRTRAEAAEAERDQMTAAVALCQDLLGRMMTHVPLDAALRQWSDDIDAVDRWGRAGAVDEWHRRYAEEQLDASAYMRERDTATQRAEAAEARLAALTAAVEACDQKMTRLSADDETDGPFVTMYQVLAGPWHRVLAVARGALPIDAARHVKGGYDAS